MTFPFLAHVSESMRERFESRISFDGACWEWTGSISKGGYGQFAYGHEDKRGAHRVAWMLSVGPIPSGMAICHTCDNRRCVRPDHLWIGTIEDNIADMDRKGRRNSSPRHRGETTPKAKLTESLVRHIRNCRSAGMTCQSISELIGVNESTVNRIGNRKTWKHI